jgi:hypothetical protein
MVNKRKKVTKAEAVKRRRRFRVRNVVPYASWSAGELAAAQGCSDNQIYDEMNDGRCPFVFVGRLKRIPYAVGKERLGDLTDEQILALRRHLAERRIAALGDRAIVEKAEWPDLGRSRNDKEAPVTTAA